MRMNLCAKVQKKTFPAKFIAEKAQFPSNNPHLAFERQFLVVDGKDDNLLTRLGIAVVEHQQVGVAQTDTTLAALTGNGLGIVGRTVDTDRAIAAHVRVAVAAAQVETHKPVAIGQYVASSVLEVMPPCMGIFDLQNIERLSH